MVKKAVCVLLCLSMIFPLGGCWSYIGLNEITIVAGVGIDYDKDSKEYMITSEVIDLSKSNKQTGIKSKIVESSGKTIFEAIRSAKRKLINKLYWGNDQLLVIGKELAQEGKISAVIDWFMSDEESRETVDVVISQEKTAGELLKTEGLTESVTSYELREIVNDDQHDTASIRKVSLYQIFNLLRARGVSLTLPALHLAKNVDKSVVEANGVAVFKKDNLIGYLSPNDTKSYLFAVGDINGGVLPVSSTNENEPDVSLEITKSKTKTTYSYQEGKITVEIKIDTDVSLDEVEKETDLLDEKEIAGIESNAQKMIEKRVSDVIKTVQTEYDSDIFGFGNMIYKKDPRLWDQLEPQWDKIFQTVQVKVTSKVNIVNTAFLKAH